jgi:nucleotidyltransferase/DNA polymerase involved in DNA repair
VGTGTPVREAKKILPADAVYLPTDFVRYKEVSSRLMELLTSLSSKIEVFSIDEAFIDITDRQEKYNLDYPTLAKKLQQKILQEIGIPTSVGFAPTRILAKMFAEINKPLGTHVCLDQKSITETLADHSLADIPFVGRKSFERREYFCATAKDFA